MEKAKLHKILARADRSFAISLANQIREKSKIEIIKKPEKALTMIKMREPVKETLFYLGEVLVTEVTVSVNEKNGKSVLMGDDFEKATAIAIVDGACNAGIFTEEKALLEEEERQQQKIKQENAIFAKTMVNFNTMN